MLSIEGPVKSTYPFIYIPNHQSYLGRWWACCELNISLWPNVGYCLFSRNLTW